jgi:alpha-beta hydrolase superfamily lysophospholipase
VADIDGGRIAYEVTGHGPLIVLSHRIGDHRQVYRFLAPELAQGGYQVANMDLRGHGGSAWAGHQSLTLTWPAYSRDP